MLAATMAESDFGLSRIGPQAGAPKRCGKLSLSGRSWQNRRSSLKGRVGQGAVWVSFVDCGARRNAGGVKLERPQPLVAARTYELDDVRWDGAMVVTTKEETELGPLLVGGSLGQLQWLRQVVRRRPGLGCQSSLRLWAWS
jgi:hypothetical protein